MNRRYCIMLESGFSFQMAQLSLDAMDKLFDVPRVNLPKGFPLYFDENGRQWPLPDDRCVVVEEIKTP